VIAEIGMQWLPKMKITNEKFQLVTAPAGINFFSIIETENGLWSHFDHLIRIFWPFYGNLWFLGKKWIKEERLLAVVLAWLEVSFLFFFFFINSNCNSCWRQEHPTSMHACSSFLSETSAEISAVQKFVLSRRVPCKIHLYETLLLPLHIC